MLLTVTDKFPFKPTIDRSIVIFNIMVKIRLKFVCVKDLNGAFLPPSSYWLSLTQVDLYMNHSMRKGFQFRICICGTIENKISWFQIFLDESLVRKKVELIGLVPFPKSVTEILSQVKDALPDQSTTVDEKGCIVERLARLVEFLGIGYSYVFMGSLDKLLSELVFELWWCSINLNIFEVFVEFELIEFFFLELLKGILDGDFGCKV